MPSISNIRTTHQAKAECFSSTRSRGQTCAIAEVAIKKHEKCEKRKEDETREIVERQENNVRGIENEAYVTGRECAARKICKKGMMNSRIGIDVICRKLKVCATVIQSSHNRY